MPQVFADVGVGVTDVRVFLDGADVGFVPVLNGQAAYDVSGVSVGQHSVELTSIINDPLWGALESPRSAPLSFTRPGVPAAPTQLRLA